ncbi:hypothetical protein G6N76_23000 [Rhizobium daejeonense]|uniref:Uncharacterized protein n=1 Tax=Rhizobium daejeonense TaxID=240521 RepID=A0A6M1SBF7_9HYPH|nr:hypothetical protein [Rhizobium daejeonense]NGO66540.1 hypothetical protein [Rhizobium daejeonense]
MATGLHRTGFRAVIALMLVVSTLVFMAAGFAAHNPGTLGRVQVERHATLKTQQAGEDHVHDDGSVEERASGHLHGHNPGDHSHETARAAQSFTVIAVSVDSSLRVLSDRFAHEGVAATLERPPKPIFRT